MAMAPFHFLGLSCQFEPLLFGSAPILAVVDVVDVIAASSERTSARTCVILVLGRIRPWPYRSIINRQTEISLSKGVFHRDRSILICETLV